MGALAGFSIAPGERVLVYGIGNVGRQDDGIGPGLVERLAAAPLPSRVALESGYQLQPEDALLVAGFDVVLFADATVEPGAAAPFSLRPVEPSGDAHFTTHALSAGGVLALCRDLFDRRPRAFLLAVPGYAFEIGEGLSAAAAANLDVAADSLCGALGCMSSPS